MIFSKEIKVKESNGAKNNSSWADNVSTMIFPQSLLVNTICFCKSFRPQVPLFGIIFYTILFCGFQTRTVWANTSETKEADWDNPGIKRTILLSYNQTLRFWDDAACESRKQFICSYEPKFSCPQGWTRHPSLGTCYWASHVLTSWSSAVQLCKVKFIHK